MKKTVMLLVSLALASTPAFSKAKPDVDVKLKNQLLESFKKEERTNTYIGGLSKDVLKHGPKAVPALIEVMKHGKYPDRNRWLATFLLGKIMGDKSAPFLARFTEHPHWILRMASLKTLLALGQKSYGKLYSKMLNDDSLVVRSQALENIAQLQLAQYAPNVWAMLYDKRNYYQSKGMSKRSHLIEKVIKTVGDLSFDKAKDPLLKMITKKKYKDVYDSVEYALVKITGKNPPKGTPEVRRVFWERMAMNGKTI